MKTKLLSILIVIMFWVLFPVLSFLKLNNNLSFDFLGKSFILASIYLLAVPIIFYFLFFIFYFKKDKTKKFFIWGILMPLILWSLFIVAMYILPVAFFSFG